MKKALLALLASAVIWLLGLAALHVLAAVVHWQWYWVWEWTPTGRVPLMFWTGIVAMVGLKEATE